MDRAIEFAGAEHELYTRIKAEALCGLAGRLIGEPKSLDALDVGCGPGLTDRLLEGRFGSLTGVDVAEAMVAEASRRNPWARYVAYREGEPLPFDGARFDLSFTICVLHHVRPSGWDEFAAEIARVTRPGGVAAIFEHNPWNPLARKVVRDCEFDADVELASRRQVVRLLSEAGMEVVEGPYIVFFPREGRALRRLERSIARVPLGAQYYVAARRR